MALKKKKILLYIPVVDFFKIYLSPVLISFSSYFLCHPRILEAARKSVLRETESQPFCVSGWVLQEAYPEMEFTVQDVS